ncbi:SDR family oxidoreductase [Candidatus Pelagibacter bacterium]|nr:SDR family oxidoreductase [Candidatus Pelagibacter bacterium]
MKLLITGACGHIGSFIIEKVKNIKKIKEVVLIDNFNSHRYSTLFNLKKNKKYSFYNIDLSKVSLINFKKVDYIIHCASLTNAQGSFSIKKEMFRNNISCMKNVIDYCIKNKSKLIHISSTSVYGKQVKIVNENDQSLLNPQSPYAEIKLQEEKMLEKNKNKIKFMSFRFGTIAGVSKGMRFHTAINKFCFNAALNEKILVYKTAYNQYRPYLSLKDAFKVFKFCIDKDIFNNEVYNALSGNYTVKQIIKMVKKYKKKISIKFVKTKIMNQLSYHVDNKKLIKLGLKLNSPVQNDIKDTIKLLSGLKY